MTLRISKVFTYDEDAGNYIQAVEAADGQALEGATRKAINNFVLGCKQDGIWSAIKASCILAGARTLAGALVPLVGAAPTNFNFVAGDYNRKTGLVGNGSTKYLDCNRNDNADPVNSKHKGAYVTTLPTVGTFFMGAAGGSSNDSDLFIFGGLFNGKFRSGTNVGDTTAVAGYLGLNRASSTQVTQQVNRNSIVRSVNSTNFFSGNDFLFARNLGGTPLNYVNARIAFYSIGESLDLALLSARVTDLINALGAAIP